MAWLLLVLGLARRALRLLLARESGSAPAPHAALVPAVWSPSARLRSRFGFSAPSAPRAPSSEGQERSASCPQSNHQDRLQSSSPSRLVRTAAPPWSHFTANSTLSRAQRSPRCLTACNHKPMAYATSCWICVA